MSLSPYKALFSCCCGNKSDGPVTVATTAAILICLRGDIDAEPSEVKIRNNAGRKPLASQYTIAIK